VIGDFSFSRFGFIVRTVRHRFADDRYTHATPVGVKPSSHRTPEAVLRWGQGGTGPQILARTPNILVTTANMLR